jgi:putative Holliday junction resolvase
VPKSGKSSEEMKRRIEHFVSLIDFDKEIVFVDEDFSSFEAANITKGVFKHKKDGKIDSVAAKIILERYLESSNQNKSNIS